MIALTHMIAVCINSVNIFASIFRIIVQYNKFYKWLFSYCY